MSREYILNHAAQLGPAETARRVGCDEKTVRNIMKAEAKAEEQAQAAPAPTSDLDRLIELRGILWRRLQDAPSNAVAGISREYREVCERITQMQGGEDGDPIADGLDAIADAIAKRLPPA